MHRQMMVRWSGDQTRQNESLLIFCFFWIKVKEKAGVFIRRLLPAYNDEQKLKLLHN
jgi:hypothetical protein